MKRILWIVAVVAVLAGLGLWSMRFLGESRIEGALNKAKAEIGARGWALTWGTRQAKGFPVANRVHLTDVALVSELGVLIKVGDVVVAQDTEAPGALVVRLPEEVRLTVPIGALARQQTPFLPPRVDVTFTTEDARLRVGAGETGALTVILTASVLRAALDQSDFPVRLAIDAGSLSLESDVAENARRFRLKSGSFALDLRDSSERGALVVDSRYTELSIGATARADGIDAFFEGLQKLTDQLAKGAFQSASQVVTVSSLQPGAGTGRPTSLTWKAGPQTGVFRIDKGTLGYSAEDRDVVATLDRPTARGFDRYTASMLYYQREFELPFVNTGQTPRPGSLRIAVEDFLPDEATWQGFDPEVKLAREPADLLFDAKASLRLTPGRGGLPIEFSNISLETFRLTALGATAEAVGDVEVLQPIALPLGEIKVILQGAGALVEGLHGIGVLDDEKAEMTRAILQVYARPAADADRHDTEVAFTKDGMLINGRTIDGRTPGRAPEVLLDPTRPSDGTGAPDADPAPEEGSGGGPADGTPEDGDEAGGGAAAGTPSPDADDGSASPTDPLTDPSDDDAPDEVPAGDVPPDANGDATAPADPDEAPARSE